MSNTLLTDSTIFARRNLEHIRQVPEKLTNVTIQPLMFVVLFAYVFGGAIKVEGAGYKEYLIGGILIQTLAFAMMGPAMSIATDLQEGVIDRFRSLPSRRSAYLLGHYFAEMLGSILTVDHPARLRVRSSVGAPTRRSSTCSRRSPCCWCSPRRSSGSACGWGSWCDHPTR